MSPNWEAKPASGILVLMFLIVKYKDVCVCVPVGSVRKSCREPPGDPGAIGSSS